LTAANFAAAVAQAKQDLRGLVPRLGDWLKEIFTLRLALATHPQSYPGLAEDLAGLLAPEFLRTTPFERIRHLPRYLKARQLRADRWKRDAAKDAQRAAELAPFVSAVRRFSAGAGLSRDQSGHKAPPTAEEFETFRWLVEEFRVSLFAQELGTAEPVSAVRLQRLWDELGREGSLSAVEDARRGAESAPYLKPATATKKGAPLKSLGALDQLFRK
jgi:ATP-dependent helicase HrpA